MNKPLKKYEINDLNPPKRGDKGWQSIGDLAAKAVKELGRKIDERGEK